MKKLLIEESFSFLKDGHFLGIKSKIKTIFLKVGKYWVEKLRVISSIIGKCNCSNAHCVFSGHYSFIRLCAFKNPDIVSDEEGCEESVPSGWKLSFTYRYVWFSEEESLSHAQGWTRIVFVKYEASHYSPDKIVYSC